MVKLKYYLIGSIFLFSGCNITQSSKKLNEACTKVCVSLSSFKNNIKENLFILRDEEGNSLNCICKFN